MRVEALLTKIRTELKYAVDNGKIEKFEIREYYGFKNSFSIFTIYVDGIMRGQLDEHNTDEIIERFLSNVR